MVIGSRFADLTDSKPGPCAASASVFFRSVLRPILGKPVHDPTSGFVGVNRTALGVFSASFPLEYPEIEALVVLQRRRFRFDEIPCQFRPRSPGARPSPRSNRSTILCTCCSGCSSTC